MNKYIGSVALACLLSACGTPLKLSDVSNGGDAPPYLDIAEIKAGNYGNLSRTETVVAAQGSDEAVAKTNRTNIVFFERVMPPSSSGGSAAAGGGEKPKVFRLAATKLVQQPSGAWVFDDWVDVHDKTQNQTWRNFRIVALNTGDKPFQGSVVISDNLDGRITFSGINKASVVHDQTDLRVGLSLIPIIGLAAMAVDQYGVIDANPRYTIHEQDGLLQIRFDNLALAPKDGVLVEFSANLSMPGIDEMRQSATPLKAMR